MKISEVTVAEVKRYLNLDSEADEPLLEPILSAAKAYVSGYTGRDIAEVDSYEDMTIALLVLCADMYDNRQMTVSENSVNKVVQSILDMHCFNLL